MKRLLILGLLAVVSCSGPKYEPTWESLSQYGQAPEWFRDAKLGLWAHWGPQCQPEFGDWYARLMYEDGTPQSSFHREKYGDPAEFGFKDIIHIWTADNWDPEAIVSKFKRAGAKYFVAMANHHDNFDLWDSSHQTWNSVNIGPHKNIIAGWEKAARREALPFGVSVHASHAWLFYDSAQAYDGKLTKADGAGTWWEGLDPQELYVQEHPRAQQWGWEWQDTVSVPSEAYRQNFLERTTELIDKYSPDFVYFDDTVLPFWPISDEGLRLTAYLYNKNPKAVVTGKLLKEEHKSALVYDVERGVVDDIQEKPWQTCTCIGQWHYDRGLYERDGYVPAPAVIRMLIDIVSKNGNLLLSIPVRADGTIDDKEEAILDDMAAWMDVNGEAIYGTRPWRVFGEGAGIRFTSKGSTLYAHILEWPSCGTLMIKSLAGEEISDVHMLGQDSPLEFTRTAEGLQVTLPGIEKDYFPKVLSLEIATR
jgi:alpha-L-fucosidase